jgi:hypothetical protein
MAWVAPKGYALCPESSCAAPKRNGKAADGYTIWQCQASEKCKADCGCYLCVIAPGESHLRIDDAPGGKGYSRLLPPGWAYVCACMRETGEPKESGWDHREDVGWIAPSGYKFVTPCPEHCHLPYHKAGTDGWQCGGETETEKNCHLVGVAPGEKQLHLLRTPGGVLPFDDVPPGWSIFCICLERT